MNKVILPVLCALLFGCAGTRQLAEKPVTKIRFLGQYLLPDKTTFRGTRVGGLSGIDYSPSEDLFYLLSDDRSDHNPARFYTAKIFVSAGGIDGLRFVTVDTLRQKNGQPYPNRLQDSLRVPDPEALRLNGKTGGIVWSSEGERIVRERGSVLLDPSVTAADKRGRLLDTFPLPPNLRVSAADRGPRRNGVFEGLAFAPDFQSLFVSVEEPLYNDGPRAGVGDSTAWVRIVRYNANTRQPVAQYAYQIDAVVRKPVPAGGFRINGVPDILAVNDHQLLVTERSYSAGYVGCNVRLYLADITGAEDVSGVASLHRAAPKKYLRKTLVLNLDNLGLPVYNMEGATFGPRLPNGKRSLLLVADDNFATEEKTQFLLFEID